MHLKQTLIAILIKHIEILITHQDVNRGPAEGNGVCKDNHDPMSKMEEACKVSYYVRPRGRRGCSGYKR